MLNWGTKERCSEMGCGCSYWGGKPLLRPRYVSINVYLHIFEFSSGKKNYPHFSHSMLSLWHQSLSSKDMIIRLHSFTKR